MKLIRYFFQKRMVIILFLIFILINLFTKNYKHYCINKTVGWAFDITEFSLLIFLFSFYSFLFVYGIFALSKKETNLTISIGHAIIISVSAALLDNNNNGFLMIFNCISIIVFLLNMFKSLKTHKKLNKQTVHNS
ncbi:hypothetical protein PMI10_04022 [Flavobacterium sp. CF136]|nr:hypothetical protein PMI10_04022 [Flavobacterium sp. CF136]